MVAMLQLNPSADAVAVSEVSLEGSVLLQTLLLSYMKGKRLRNGGQG